MSKVLHMSEIIYHRLVTLPVSSMVMHIRQIQLRLTSVAEMPVFAMM